MQNFSDIVRAAMEENGIKIAAIARETGYSWGYISDLLKNKRRWNEVTMNKVGTAVGIEISFNQVKPSEAEVS